MSDVPAGWQPDPEVPGGLRYWDGTQWTDHRQAAPAPAPTYPPPGAAAYGAPAAYGQPVGTPFVPTGAPVTNNNSGCLKWGLIALGVVVVFTIIGAGCLVFVGKNAVDSIAKNVGVADSGDYAISTPTCTVNRTTSAVEVSGTIKNKRNRRQAYSIRVEVDGANNVLLGSTSTYQPRLAKDQTGNWSATVFTSVPEGETPTCKVTEVDYSF